MKTVYTQESSLKVAANASGYVYYMQGKRVSWIFTGKQRQRKDHHLVILSLSLSLYVQQLAYCYCNGRRKVVATGSPMRLLLAWKKSSAYDFNVDVSTMVYPQSTKTTAGQHEAISNNRNFAILFPSMVVSKLTRENKLKKKDNHRLVS